MSHPVRRLVVAVAFLVLPGVALGASKVKIAAIGDEAPGGGVFAGPSFTGFPHAAGNGWIAFRSLLTESSAAEQIVVTNRVTGERKVVANLGQEVSDAIGRLKQFLGRPTVNANGHVAFAAVVTPPDDVQRDFLAPTPAGIFFFDGTTLTAVAPPDLDTGVGILDLTTPINLFTDASGIDIPERTPALNDADDVAFVSALVDSKFRSAGGALFIRRAGGALVPAAKLGDGYDGGTFQILGPPALNNVGGVAFRGFVDGPTQLDGIFSLVDGVPTLLVRDGLIPTRTGNPGFPNDQPLSPGDFQDTVVMNDQGDVVFSVGSFFDNSDNASLDDLDGSPGVLLYHAGMTFLLGYPGQTILGRGRVTDTTLSATAGSQVAPPALAPDGTVVFYAALNGGSSEMILRNAPLDPEPDILVEIGGSQPDATPAGGTYLLTTSAPVLDAAGSLVFSARLAGATTAQAIIYDPPSGTSQAIVIGDAAPAPTQGFFGGPPFFQPHMNDAGDVVFKSFIARGPGLGIFRFRNGALEAMVRLRDTTPLPGAPPILDLVGEPSINAAGDIAFAALVPITSESGNTTAKRGIFTAGSGGLRTLVMPGDTLNPPDPNRPEAFFRTIAANPALSDSGAVAFRASIEYFDPIDPVFLPNLKEDGLFLADATGIHLLAVAEPATPGDPLSNSGTPDPFLRFRDPTLESNRVAFRAELGEAIATRNGMFLADSSGVVPIAIEGSDLGGMTLTTLSGRAVEDSSGAITFQGKIRRPGKAEAGAILRRTGNGFTSIVETGTIGPNGGQLRSFGRPAIAPNGNVAFRANFESFTGGSPGFLLSTPSGLATFLRVGENAAASVGGRLLSVNQNASLSSSNLFAFIGTVGGGSARSAMFLAAPTTLRVGALAMRRGPGPLDATTSLKPKDTIKVKATLEPATNLPRPAPPKKPQNLTRRAVSVAVADMKGALIAVTVPPASIEARGRSLAIKADAEQRAQLKSLKVRAGKNGTFKVTFKTAPFDINFAPGLRKTDDSGAVILEPPFTVRVDVGDEGGTVAVPCKATGRRFSCG